MKGAPDIILPKVAYMRKKVRKCDYCGLKLSQYNENKYCFAHMWVGIKKEAEDQREANHKAYLQQKKDAEKKRKLRKAGVR